MFELLEDAGVVDAMGSAACEENAACGRRLMAIGELYARRAPEDDVDRINWAIDGHANVVAEIAAALNISRGRAAGQLRYAIDLRERLPQVAEVFATGAIDFRMMAELVNRGENVTDADLGHIPGRRRGVHRRNRRRYERLPDRAASRIVVRSLHSGQPKCPCEPRFDTGFDLRPSNSWPVRCMILALNGGTDPGLGAVLSAKPNQPYTRVSHRPISELTARLAKVLVVAWALANTATE
jgi:Domain of unknown function (DUF222)